MRIIEHVPINFQTDVVRNVFFKVRFDASIDRSTVNDYTVILVETASQTIIPISVDYIVATNTITAQLFDILKKGTDYTLILVGGSSGIFGLSPHEPFSLTNYSFSFVTGEIIDPNQPLAPKVKYQDGEPFQGADGIYKVVYGRTGEPVAHIVTTSAQVGPAGTIVPAPWGAERYIHEDEVPEGDVFSLVKTTPAPGLVGISTNQVIFEFNGNIASVEGLAVKLYDIAGRSVGEYDIQTNYTYTINEKLVTVTIAPTLGTFRVSSIYEVKLGKVISSSAAVINNAVVNFSTIVTPLYASVQEIRLSLRSLITAEKDSEIETLLYLNSMWIYENAAITFSINEPSKPAIAYVLCKTKSDLLFGKFLSGGDIKRKTLADLTIEYGVGMGNVINRKFDELEKCLEHSLDALGVTVHVGPVSAIKAKSDPRMPITETSWQRLKNKDFE